MSQISKPSGSSTKTAARPPERKIGPFANGVGVSIWLNTAETQEGTRTFRSITINPRRYFDRESNQWKDAASYNLADLPALIFALQKAQDYIFEKSLGGDDVVNGEAQPPATGDIPF